MRPSPSIEIRCDFPTAMLERGLAYGQPARNHCAVVNEPFQIEEILAQDATGITFRASGRQTGELLAVRRFFPFGPDGGGLDETERAAYLAALQRLAETRHPALRAIVGGGCDPNDGMPFIVTAWSEGIPLDQMLKATETGSLRPPLAIRILDEALTASLTLSETLGSEALWLDTHLSAIIVTEDENATHAATFSIAPLKWLNGRDTPPAARALADLTESMLSWTGRVVGGQAGLGLGAWLKWLRGAGADRSLTELRNALHFTTGTGPNGPAEMEAAIVEPSLPRPTPPPPNQFSRPIPLKKPSSNTGAFAIGLVAVVAVAAAGFYFLGPQPEKSATAASAPAADSSAVPQPPASPTLASADAPAEALAARAETTDSVAESVPINPASPHNRRIEEMANRMLADQGKTEFTTDDAGLLLGRKNDTVTLTGTVAGVRASESGKTLYLEFSNQAPTTQPRGYLLTSSAPPGLDATALEAHIGKSVRLTGKVRIENFGDVRRAEILIARPDAIVPAN